MGGTSIIAKISMSLSIIRLLIYIRVGSHVVFAWMHCTDVRIHCTDILIECR